MKKLVIFTLLSTFVFANMHFEKNKKCSACHATIYDEYMTSQHAKATVFKDPIHGAIYNMHPQKNKKNMYRCAHCHTPTASNLEALTKKNGGLPDANSETQNEAVACAYCHRIEDVEPAGWRNKNIVSKEAKVYFTAKDTPGNSPFHGLKTNKDIFKDGKLCMGCHAHKSNGKNFQVCATDISNNPGEKSCIECHMHKVDGAPSIMSSQKQHTYHGFPGLHGDLTSLSQYVKLHIAVKDDNKMFGVMIEHDVPHSSTMHPLRAAKLMVSITSNGTVTEMHDIDISKTIGNIKGESPSPAPPWLATQIVNDSTIYPNSKKPFPYAWDLKSGDIITAKFGYYLVKPKALKKFNLQDNKEATKFRVIQEQSLTVK